MLLKDLRGSASISVINEMHDVYIIAIVQYVVCIVFGLLIYFFFPPPPALPPLGPKPALKRNR